MNENKNKEMSVIIEPTIRAIIKAVSINNIQKESIVTLIKDNEDFILVYYK